MIPSFVYNVLNRNGNSSNDNNNDSNDNPDNEENLRNIHLHDSTYLDHIISSRQQQQQQQQQDEVPMAPTSTNQSVFNNSNLRFGAPVCILRAPPGFDVPSTYENSSEQQQPPLSAILLPPNFIPPTSKSNEPVEAAKTSNETSGGKFADKYHLHVIPVEGNNNNLFTNKISYNTQTDAYYENGDLSHKYLKHWKEGAYHWDNIDKKIERDWMKTYLAKIDNNETMHNDAEISWKFDYRTGSYVINSLNLKLSFAMFDNLAKVQWFIKPLPTKKNPDPAWQLIQFDPYTEHRHEVNEVKDVTQLVKNEYGFILKAHLSGGENNKIAYQKTQLFRQSWSEVSAGSLDIENDETFGLDVNVELKPDIIVDPLPELFVLNDKSTSDFVIHYKISNTEETKDFHVHSLLLSRRSDYFSALLESKMVESQNKSLTLTDDDVSYESLEIILNYLYYGNLPDIKNYDEWSTLLLYASRFLIPTLIQRCEKELKSYLNFDNLNEIETISKECGAEQLLHCCEGFEPNKGDD